MLEKPDLPDKKIIACLQAEYGLHIAEITFLPLGADVNTAVYRVTADAGAAYFLKLRSGVFDELSVMLPKFLGDQGIAPVIVPLAASTGQLWTDLEAFKVILYPFVEGRNGYEVDLSDRHWIEFGAALKRIHGVPLPAALSSRIQRETYSPRWRDIVKTILARIENDALTDPVAAQSAAFLQNKRAQTYMEDLKKAAKIEKKEPVAAARVTSQSPLRNARVPNAARIEAMIDRSAPGTGTCAANR